MTVEERCIIAEAYDRGILKVIVATCSLAAGINLPARRVIVQEAYMGKEHIGPAMLCNTSSTYFVLHRLIVAQATNAWSSRT